DDVEDAGRVGMAGAFGLALEDSLDEVFLALLRAGLELEVAADRADLIHAPLAQVDDVEIVPLAGGFELLLLFEFGDRRAGRHLGTASRATVPLALVGELGHEFGGSSGCAKALGTHPGWTSRGIDPRGGP